MEKQMDEKGEDSSARPDRRRRLCEPDVTVVVGGVEFKHYSQFLCGFSGFFDSALNSGMKEEHEKRVELQGDWDPEEWKEVASFIDPSLVYSPDAAKVTKDNVHMLLPWFHYLEMTNLLKECETCLRSFTLKDNICNRGAFLIVGGVSRDSPELSRGKSELSLLCDSFASCVRYDFNDLKKDIQLHLIRIIEESPDFFTLESVAVLVSAISDGRDAGTQEVFWDKFKVYLPLHIKEGTSRDDLGKLFANVLLPSLIYEGMILFALAEREQFLPGLILGKVRSTYHASRHEIEEVFQKYPGMRYTLDYSNNS